MMLKHPYFVGLGAGAVAAMLFLSITTGSAIGLLLFYLAPLPFYIAGFGWGMRAVVVTALVGGLMILAGLGPVPSVTFLIALALPALILTHFVFMFRYAAPPDDVGTTESRQETPETELELSGKPTASESPEPVIEWYPSGNLVLIIAIYGGLLAALTVMLLGGSHEAYLKTIDSEFAKITGQARESGLLKEMTDEQLAQFKQAVENLLPASTAILWTLLTLLNIWLAGQIVRVSERLKRPWPDLAWMEFPALFSLLTLFAIGAAMYLPGYGGLLLTGMAGALMMAFLVLGLAIVHAITRGHSGRGLMLFAVYAAVLVIGWGALILIGVALAEPWLGLRQKFSKPTD